MARRNRLPVSEITRPAPPGQRAINLGGVVMFENELSPAEARDIDAFLRAEQGKPLRGVLQSTMGFAQLTRTLAQMNALAAECGVDLK